MDLASALLFLKMNGVTKIIVEYNGSGDSGSIDNITLDYGEEHKRKNIDSQHEFKEIKEVIETQAYEVLETVSDWYNNDGGYGNIEINVETGNYEVQNNIRITEIETEYAEGNFFQELS